MFSTPIIVFIVGICICFFSFIAGLVNMFFFVKGNDMEKGFGRHIGIMICLVIGGFTSVIGAIMFLIPIIQKLVEA